jgi:hypothetical protein
MTQHITTFCFATSRISNKRMRMSEAKANKHVLMSNKEQPMIANE